MSDISDQVNEAVDKASEGGRLNSIIAILVALAATCMAIDNVKDGNIGQAMAQQQAQTIDSWSYYQAKSTKQNVAEAALDQLLTMRELATSAAAATAIDARIATYRDQVARYEKEKADIKTEAEGHQRQYDALNQRDDQFDLSDAGFSLAIALLGIAALTKRRWLVFAAGVLLIIGFTFGVAGFFNLPWHPDQLMSWLS